MVFNYTNLINMIIIILIFQFYFAICIRLYNLVKRSLRFVISSEELESLFYFTDYFKRVDCDIDLFDVGITNCEAEWFLTSCMLVVVGVKCI